VSASYAPPQEHRGWAQLAPHGALAFAGERWALDGELGVRLRQADLEERARVRAVRQLQIEGQLEATLGGRWRLALEALASIYDLDLAGLAVSRANAGLLVTVGVHPESWAVGVRLDVAVHARVRLQAGALGIAYATTDGGAVVPRAALRLGPWAGLTLSPSVELVVGVGGAGEPGGPAVRPIAGLLVELEHHPRRDNR
jgi:hypothetical protein